MSQSFCHYPAPGGAGTSSGPLLGGDTVVSSTTEVDEELQRVLKDVDEMAEGFLGERNFRKSLVPMSLTLLLFYMTTWLCFLTFSCPVFLLWLFSSSSHFFIYFTSSSSLYWNDTLLCFSFHQRDVASWSIPVIFCFPYAVCPTLSIFVSVYLSFTLFTSPMLRYSFLARVSSNLLALLYPLFVLSWPVCAS